MTDEIIPKSLPQISKLQTKTEDHSPSSQVFEELPVTYYNTSGILIPTREVKIK